MHASTHSRDVLQVLRSAANQNAREVGRSRGTGPPSRRSESTWGDFDRIYERRLCAIRRRYLPTLTRTHSDHVQGASTDKCSSPPHSGGVHGIPSDDIVAWQRPPYLRSTRALDTINPLDVRRQSRHRRSRSTRRPTAPGSSSRATSTT